MKKTGKKIAQACPPRSACAFFFCALLFSACSELKRPTIEPFYAETVPPPRQELTWSNGKMPVSLDPARAAAAPETDVVRAISEGLTDLDSRTLNEIPGVAEKWVSSSDLKTWTFNLRKDARWSNGERVTARDFVRSWKRLAAMDGRATNSYLVQNIVGMSGKATDPTNEPSDFIPQTQTETAPTPENPPSGLTFEPPVTEETAPPPPKRNSNFGVEAVNDSTLRVTLKLPDKDFSKLVANPIFRPVFGSGSNFEQVRLDPALVTNGAFQIAKIDDKGLIIERSDTYWNRRAVALERVHFVPAKTAEAALDAYRRGEVDLVTNTAFEPLALKLLAPYEDFRRTAHNALNFYEFNTSKAPFSDRRVREALAISIDRDKLTEGDLEGSMRPAHSFFPIGERSESLAFDLEKARDLLDKAGYPAGSGFPTIRLVINRNDAQQRVARSIAKMWKQHLDIETAVMVRDAVDVENIRVLGDFDILRRGVVLPVNDELVNLASVLGSAEKSADTVDQKTIEAIPPTSERGPTAGQDDESAPVESGQSEILTQEQAIYELKAIPLYFPISYSLVKPYVLGYEINGLDTVSLGNISIDNQWQPKPKR